MHFTLKLAAWLWPIFALLTITGCAYALFAAALLRRFARKPAISGLSGPGLTVLKPLCGAEPALETNLASFCEQDYGDPVQLVFGIHDSADPAGAIVRRLEQRFPDRDIELVVDPSLHGSNRKISNLANMLAAAKHGIIVASDSDIRVGRNYFAGIVSALAEPNVGIVTCLYYGIPVRGLWSSLAAAAINHHFLPSVLVGLKLGLARPCFGSTLALRAETLERIGGFKAFANLLADDYAMGEAVRRLGLTVAIAPLLVGHTCAEESLGALLSHELRWARTLRSLDPLGYMGLVITHPLPLALAAAAMQGFSAAGIALITLALACRFVVSLQIGAIGGAGERGVSPFLSPPRDLLSAMMYVAGFLPAPIVWRGHRYELQSDGTLTPS
jgi:ceramide glucosyltransferase